MLTETQTLLFSVQPFDVDWPCGSRNDCVFEFFDCFFCISQGGKLYKRRASEGGVLLDEFHIENFAKLFKELPDIVFLPASWEIPHVDDQLDPLGGEIFLGRDWRLRPLFGFIFGLFLLF